jgi:hypothetical protein
MTTSPATAERNAMLLSAECTKVPCFFCLRVWVGCRMRIAWMRKRKAAELRRGCAEKRMRSLLKMAPQIMAAICEGRGLEMGCMLC